MNRHWSHNHIPKLSIWVCLLWQVNKRNIDTSKTFGITFCSMVELHGCMAASWGGDLDERESMSG